MADFPQDKNQIPPKPVNPPSGEEERTDSKEPQPKEVLRPLGSVNIQPPLPIQEDEIVMRAPLTVWDSNYTGLPELEGLDESRIRVNRPDEERKEGEWLNFVPPKDLPVVGDEQGAHTLDEIQARLREKEEIQAKRREKDEIPTRLREKTAVVHEIAVPSEPSSEGFASRSDRLKALARENRERRFQEEASLAARAWQEEDARLAELAREAREAHLAELARKAALEMESEPVVEPVPVVEPDPVIELEPIAEPEPVVLPLVAKVSEPEIYEMPELGPAPGPMPEVEEEPEEEFHENWLVRYLIRVGETVSGWLYGIGDFALFTWNVFIWLLQGTRRGTLLPCMYEIGIMSLPVIALTGTFIGMVLAVQSYNQLKDFYLETRIGALINLSLVRELGPVLAATMLAGRIGSSMAAELGTMRVTEQIDALGSMGVNPIHYLVVPRFLGCVLLIPVLSIFADFMGVVGGAYFSVWIYNIDWHFYLSNSNKIVGEPDIFLGIFKSFFFGATIGLIGCHRGFNSRAGAQGVGRAATEAFVFSFVFILLLDLALGTLFESVESLIFPHMPRQL